MSEAIQCDNCGRTLTLDSRGDDAHGEIVAWIEIKAAGESWDACTRSCASQLLDSDNVRLVIEAAQEGVAEVIRILNEET